MIDYKTKTAAHPQTEVQSASLPPDELLEENRAYYYRLVDQVFDGSDGDQNMATPPRGIQRSRSAPCPGDARLREVT